MRWRRMSIAVVFGLTLTVTGWSPGRTAEPPPERKSAPKEAARPEISAASAKRIKDGVGRLTEQEVLDLLGPADRLIAEDGVLTLIWEEVNRIHVTFERGPARRISGEFSRSYPSRDINPATLHKLKAGMTEDEVEKILGPDGDRIPDSESVYRSWSDGKRIRVAIKNGKVAECEHTPPKK